MDSVYNFKDTEKRLQQRWGKDKLYSYTKGKKPVFAIDTPPPYVSADHLHVGHALSYSQADFIARYQRMRGKNVFYPMGFDDNGLPTERFVEKKYNVNKSKITRKEFIALCLKETAIGAQTYRRLWDALGISVDWDLTYSTIDERCQKIAQKSFLDLYAKKRVQRREEPIMWCGHCHTALAQADLDDLQKNSFLHDIQFMTDDKPLTIATTRPELLPACVALFVNKHDKRYKSLIGKKAHVPLFNYTIPILADEQVAVDFGTGVMMVCTFGDVEDIERWKMHKLHTRIILDKDGRLNALAGSYQGLRLEEARKKIVEDLQQSTLLISQKSITHVTNVHERCSTPIEFLIAPQWYIRLLDIKDELLAIAKKVHWYPEHMKVRYDHWVENLKWDWCISRERFYGVPFPVWYCKKCHDIILAEEKTLPVDPTGQQPPITQCPSCKHKEFIPEMDVMDTWMTSSVTPLINSNWKEKQENKDVYPMQLRPQAHDIIRTWAFYTIAKSWLHTKSIPWHGIMISGHGLDSKGQKISKSKGNMIIAEDVVKEYSADALRYFATSTKLGEDVRYQDKDLKNGQKLLTKLWNSAKFTFDMLKDYDGKKPKKLASIDCWMLSKLQHTIQECTEHLDTYEFSKARAALEGFFWHTFCDNYIEIIKNRFYDDTRKETKHSAQYVLSTVLLDILKMFAPLLPFITEELYQIGFANSKKNQSIHVTDWPVLDKNLLDATIESQGDVFVDTLSMIRKFKSDHGKSLKADVDVTLSQKEFDLLNDMEDDFKAAAKIRHLTKGSFAVEFVS